MFTVKAHCNTCGGERNHNELYSERTTWEDEQTHSSGSDKYQMLKCCGCELVKLRHTSWLPDNEPAVTYFPPAIFRRSPDWFSFLWSELKIEDAFVETLLKETYVALQNNLPTLATMGVRALLEKIMISKCGDNGTFKRNIAEFERLGHVSSLQRERLETILDAGHAAMHRAYEPTVKEVITLLDITEHVVESVFLHGAKIDALKKAVPMRPKPPSN